MDGRRHIGHHSYHISLAFNQAPYLLRQQTVIPFLIHHLFFFPAKVSIFLHIYVIHASGTDRIAEVAARMGWADDAVIINVQGDEPLIAPALIAAVAETLIADTGAAMSTAAHPLTDAAECANPNVVKVVCNHAGRALYFSRAPIPWARDAWGEGIDRLPSEAPVLRHVGIYGYRAGFLRQFSALAPAPLERCEALEQLRALWHGHAIAVHRMAEAPPAGVDTPEDLARVREIFAREEGAG